MTLETEKNPAVSLAILAGGRSTRFGERKCEALLEGKAFARHVYDAAHSLVAETIVVSSDPSLAPDLPGARRVPDVFEGAGPLSGILSGLRAANSPWVLVMACDLPLVTESTLRRLVVARKSRTIAVVSRSEDGRMQPLCACYHVSVADSVETALAAGRNGVQRFVNGLSGIAWIDVPSAELLNVNTPEDLKRAELSISNVRLRK